MHIEFNTEELTDTDRKVLALLAGGETPKPETKAKPEAKVKASKPEPEEKEETSDEPSLDDAVALATKMVANGDAPKVKKALSSVGAKKVSEIPADKVVEFISELS